MPERTNGAGNPPAETNQPTNRKLDTRHLITAEPGLGRIIALALMLSPILFGGLWLRTSHDRQPPHERTNLVAQVQVALGGGEIDD